MPFADARVENLWTARAKAVEKLRAQMFFGPNGSAAAARGAVDAAFA